MPLLQAAKMEYHLLEEQVLPDVDDDEITEEEEG